MKNIIRLAMDDGSGRISIGARPETEDPGDWERDRIGTFLAFLQGRRALYAPGKTLTKHDAPISVGKICYECTAYLAELTEKSPAATSIQKIGRACRQFADSVEFLTDADFYIAVGALRATVDEQVATLWALCMVQSIGPVAAVTPPDDASAP